MQDMSSMQKQHGPNSIIINKNLKLVSTTRSKYDFTYNPMSSWCSKNYKSLFLSISLIFLNVCFGEKKIFFENIIFTTYRIKIKFVCIYLNKICHILMKRSTNSNILPHELLFSYHETYVPQLCVRLPLISIIAKYFQNK